MSHPECHSTKAVRTGCAAGSLTQAWRLATLAACAITPLVAAGRPAAADMLSRSVQVDGTPDAVWRVIGPFCAVSDWHPAIGSCVLGSRAPLTRTLVTKDGTATFVETQTANSGTDHRYSYSILASPLPVSGYAATLQVTMREGNLSTVTWSSSYTTAKGQEDAARDALVGIYETGLEAIRVRFAQ